MIDKRNSEKKIWLDTRKFSSRGSLRGWNLATAVTSGLLSRKYLTFLMFRLLKNWDSPNDLLIFKCIAFAARSPERILRKLPVAGEFGAASVGRLELEEKVRYGADKGG